MSWLPVQQTRVSRMNDDTLSRVAQFCDIDGRRALGYLPDRLRDREAIDKKLTAIHNGIVRQDITSGAPYMEYRTTLNDKMVFTVSFGKGAIHRRYEFVPGTFMFTNLFWYGSSSASCSFNGIGDSEIIVRKVIGSRFMTRRDIFCNKTGKWTHAPGYL
jgi:hypothetical protein